MSLAAGGRDRETPSRSPAALVVGTGAQTPLGRSAPASMAAARAGIVRFREHPFIFDRQLEPMIVSRAAWLPDDLPIPQRLSALAAPALREALDGARAAQRIPASRPTAFVAVPPDDRPGVGKRAHDAVWRAAVDLLSETSSKAAVELVPGGQAAGWAALQAACDALTSGRADLALVAGVDSYLGLETLRWLDAERRLHGPENPWGIVPGEAAGALAIVPFTGRRASGVTALASVEALGVSREPAPTGSGGVCIGQGLTAAFKGALAGLQDREQVAAVYCDMNGEHERGDELGFTLSRLSARLRAPGEFQAPADRWGDVGAATGPLLAAAAVASWRRGYAPGPTALLWASSGADPTRGAALLRSAIEPQPR